MARFDIGSFAASLNETVSKLDTPAPQLQYIDIDQLDAHEANFYAVDVSKLDTLADSIAMDGLQQPLVVTPGQDGRYTVISGHRRRAAIRKLVEEEGREDLRRVPCLVKAYQSQALAEVQLIMANSTARVLTPAEVMHQAQRTEELLYQLKKEGYSFPGRMRAQVAEACQVSESKLARLKVIRDKLIDPWMAKFEAGEISEDVAYTVAQMGRDYQTSLVEILNEIDYSITKNTVEGYRMSLEKIAAIECASGAACTNRERMILETRKSASPYWSTCTECCSSCVRRSFCEHVCPMVEEQVAQAAKARQMELEEAKAKGEEEAAKRAAKMVAEAECNRKRWQRLGQEFDRLGINRGEVARMWLESPEPEQIEALSSMLDGDMPKNPNCFDLDLGWELCDSFLVADFATAGVSLDYVLTGERAEVSQAGQWQQGNPTENGYYFCINRGSNWAGLYWWQDDHWEQAAAICTAYVCVDLWVPAPIIPGWRAWEREEV